MRGIRSIPRIFYYKEIPSMNTLKTNSKLITLLLSAVVVLSACSSGTAKPTDTPKTTPSPIVATRAPAVTEKTATATPEPSIVPIETTYILNTRTKKFHYPSCPSVDDMKEKNKREFTGTRDKVIAQGYTSCGRCDP